MFNEEYNIFEYFFDENVKGVYQISLVLEPAIEVDALQFSNDKRVNIDADKQILVSPVMIPDQKIWRNNINGKAGYVYASADTIKKLQMNFSKNKYGDVSMIEHNKEIEGLYINESWIIEDSKNDKANALGFNGLPKGTWMVSYHIEDKAIWDEYIKSGLVKGLSIDAILSVKKVGNEEKIKYNMDKRMIEDIVAMAIQKVALEADREEIKINDELSYFGVLELEQVITDIDGNIIIDGEFIYDNKTYFTDSLGIITKIIENEDNIDNEELEDVNQAEEVEVDPLVAIIETLEADKLLLENKVIDLEAKNVKLEADIVLLENEKVEMSKNKPASVGIKDLSIDIDNKKDNSLLSVMRRLK